MRHRCPKHQLARPADQRKAVLRSLATELLRHDEIVTTLGKAKAVRGEAEKLITLAKRGQLKSKGLHDKAKQGDQEAAKQIAEHVHTRRQIAAYVYDKEVVTRAYEVLAPRYAERKGGYTRILKAGFRRGDAAPMALIQLV
jgi:large subunit ribosomal protein L17